MSTFGHDSLVLLIVVILKCIILNDGGFLNPINHNCIISTVDTRFTGAQFTVALDLPWHSIYRVYVPVPR